MSRLITDDCIGCGACEYECPTAAITKQDEFFGRFVIDPWRCDDCGQCVEVCPIDVIPVDEKAVTCFGRGCPVNASSRSKVAGWTCLQGKKLCALCGNSLWAATSTDTAVCSRCDLGIPQYCPKFGRSAARTTHSVTSSTLA